MTPQTISLLAGIRNLGAVASQVFSPRSQQNTYAVGRFELPRLPAGGGVPIDDLETNTLARLLLERPYARLIECGAFRALRIRRIKQLFPQVDCVAADIVPGYADTGTRDGVRFIRHDDIPRELAPNTLVFGTQVFTCLEATELRRFIELCKGAGADMAVFEPAPLCTVTESVLRSRKPTYYHPYERYMREAGYDVAERPTGQKGYLDHAWFRKALLEQWRFIYARSFHGGRDARDL